MLVDELGQVHQGRRSAGAAQPMHRQAAGQGNTLTELSGRREWLE
jgi:hypothetical protein